MRAVLAALILSFLALKPAQAAYHPQHLIWRGHNPHAYHHLHAVKVRYSHRHLRARHQIRMAPTGLSRSLPYPCRVAASMGGPCGCWAEYILLGLLDHVRNGINWWLADDWLKLPHVAPAPGTAAVWLHRHVAPVVAVNNDGTVTVKDSWAVHRVRVAGLIFVQPPMRKRDGVRYGAGVPL